MKNLNFIEKAGHNRKNIDKGLRNMIIISLICAIPAVVSRLFFWGYTRRAMVTSLRNRDISYITDVGWPAQVYAWGGFFAIAFALFYVYGRFKNDLKNPSFGVTNDGIFINQQALRNAFVPWSNLQKAELLGPEASPFMRLAFKDYKALIKGQPFFLKSVAKANLKDDAVMSITKRDTVGDIRKMYEIINEKGFNGRNSGPHSMLSFTDKYGTNLKV
ncbi:hypothetical protein OGH69_04010 [Flavobacterium sp. MFBS3-15]|uniref:hypothetical protein n=1 Tax=Flavobacterium sp. MFBS3-15 TaxID=2989816 RepID=UPI00223638EE|nr:hypothetical protein [Flavobacterium sp. MFBS3-15]MCW4468120.1 hypothetical protein [Flavobacterium sp. MFBS3-15]